MTDHSGHTDHQIRRRTDLGKEQYENSLSRQVRTLDELAEIQVRKCFDLDKLRRVLDEKKASAIKRVIIVGCGDSYSAAGAMSSGFRKLSGIRKVNTPDPMDFCRFYPANRILRECLPEEALFIGLSASGSSARVAEALEKANKNGLYTLLITRKPESLCGKAADACLDVETPEGCNTPGLRSYYASLVALAAVAAYLGKSNGNLSEEEFYDAGASIAAYTRDFMKDIDRIEDQMFDLACELKDYTKFEVIADWNEGYSAQFIEQKFIECSGVYCDHTTSEEFAHISMMHRLPNEIVTMVLINKADLSLSRMKDTVNGSVILGRPTIVVTDCEASEFEEKKAFDPDSINSLYKPAVGSGLVMAETDAKPVICKIAEAPEQWMSPFVDYIPGALLASYHAALNETFFFAGTYDFRNEISVG